MAKLTHYLLRMLLLGVGLSGGLTSAAEQAPSQSDQSDQTVLCANERRFFIHFKGDLAVVTFGPRQISLPRQELRLGRYFSNEDGALLIDGQYVAFVPRGDESWTECGLARETANLSQ